MEPEGDETLTETTAQKVTECTSPVQRVTGLCNLGHEKLKDSGHVSGKLLHWKEMVKAEWTEWHGDRQSKDCKHTSRGLPGAAMTDYDTNNHKINKDYPPNNLIMGM